MKKVYFVRHGLTVFNIQDRIQDYNDELSEKGLEQAEVIADRLTRISFDLLLSSDMLRAKQTAEKIAARTGHTPQYSPLFIELRLPPSLVGLVRTDPAVSAYYEELNKNRENINWQFEDEESTAAVQKRAVEALSYLASLKEEHAVVVTHGRFLRHILFEVLLGGTITPEQEKHALMHSITSNTGISVIELTERGWQLLTFNDHAHLG